MKKITLIVMLLASTICWAQSEKLTFTETIEINNTTKNELYSRARIWFTDYFNDAQEVIQVDDKEDGQIVGKALLSYNSKIFIGSAQTSGTVTYIVKIFVKDNKYKYEITNFMHEGSSTRASGITAAAINFNFITTDSDCPYEDIKGGQGWKNKVWNDIKATINLDIDLLIPSLKDAMNTEVNSEW